MLKAKDYFKSDIDSFLNINEFGELHIIDRVQYSAVVDNDRLQERSKKEYDGVYVGDILYFINQDSFKRVPKVNDIQVFDGKPCEVFDIRKDMGMYEIILKRNES